MPSPLFDPEDEDTEDWGVGVYEAVAPKEPDGERLTRLAEAKRAGLRIWADVQKELTRDR